MLFPVYMSSALTAAPQGHFFRAKSQKKLRPLGAFIELFLCILWQKIVFKYFCYLQMIGYSIVNSQINRDLHFAATPVAGSSLRYDRLVRVPQAFVRMPHPAVPWAIHRFRKPCGSRHNGPPPEQPCSRRLQTKQFAWHIFPADRQ